MGMACSLARKEGKIMNKSYNTEAIYCLKGLCPLLTACTKPLMLSCLVDLERIELSTFTLQM